MGIVNNVLAGSSGNQGYFLSRSLRFRSSASAYLNRTPASAGSQTTWTMSMWVKRGALGVRQFITMSGVNPNSSQVWQVEFDANNKLDFYNQTIGTYRRTTQVFRDVGAWYHIVFGADTNNATAQNRFRCWVNGVEVTAWDVNSTISSGYTFAYNGAYLHGIGAYTYSGNILPIDGYLTEINFIDGQALTPSSFGFTNALTGVWQPKKYAGTYGTNGFYLPFTDNSALTTSSNVGLGRDFSGNGNYWTTNNISITAGATYDSMTDVPTLTSATTANYCVFNPLAVTSVAATFANANLQVTTGGAGGNGYGTFAIPSSGKWYWEITNATGNNQMIGISAYLATQVYAWQNGNSVFYYNNGQKYVDGSGSAYGATYTTGDVIGVAVDVDASTITFYKNNVSQGAISHTFVDVFPCLADGGSADTATFNANFGQQPFVYTPPTGFNRLNTFNLPSSTIVAGNKQMDATLYTGNGSTQTITNAAGFQPDLVWIKPRAAAVSHSLYDSVRGAFIALASNTTDADANYSPYGVTSFNSNGFSLNDVANGGYRVNGSPGGAFSGASAAYIGWQWKAGGTAVTNTAGTISAQVSANTTSGFSIATYTATGSVATIGHGLGVAPAMIIIKSRSNTWNWMVYQKTMTATSFAYLNLTNAKETDSGLWNNTAPTSSVFTIGTNGNVNYPSDTYVAYCWSEVAGFSRFGSYTGNGSADGPFVFTGFRPRFIVVKRTDASQNWFIWDAARLGYNVANYLLFADSAQAEYSGTETRIDFLSNGFKIRADSTAPGSNANGGTYIYMAFAESPFKNSNAR